MPSVTYKAAAARYALCVIYSIGGPSRPLIAVFSRSKAYMLRRQTHPILVIEDNADLRESISEILAVDGFLASGVENGKAALDMLEESQTPPALILLDLTMPVMDGVTFLEHFKQTPRFRKIPVLLMTAQEAPPASDVAALLPKPFTPRSLLSLVRQFLT